MNPAEITRIHQLNLKISSCLIQRGHIIKVIAGSCISKASFLNSTEHLGLISVEEGLLNEYKQLKTAMLSEE